MVVRGKLR